MTSININNNNNNNLSNLQFGQMAKINVMGRWMPAMYVRRSRGRYHFCMGDNNTSVTGNNVRFLNQNDLTENQIYLRDRCRALSPSSSSDEDAFGNDSSSSSAPPPSSSSLITTRPLSPCNDSKSSLLTNL